MSLRTDSLMGPSPLPQPSRLGTWKAHPKAEDITKKRAREDGASGYFSLCGTPERLSLRLHTRLNRLRGCNVCHNLISQKFPGIYIHKPYQNNHVVFPYFCWCSFGGPHFSCRWRQLAVWWGCASWCASWGYHQCRVHWLRHSLAIATRALSSEVIEVSGASFQCWSCFLPATLHWLHHITKSITWLSQFWPFLRKVSYLFYIVFWCYLHFPGTAQGAEGWGNDGNGASGPPQRHQDVQRTVESNGERSTEVQIVQYTYTGGVGHTVRAPWPRCFELPNLDVSGQEIPGTRTIYPGAHPQNLRTWTQILCVGGRRLASRVFGADCPNWLIWNLKGRCRNGCKVYSKKGDRSLRSWRGLEHLFPHVINVTPPSASAWRIGCGRGWMCLLWPVLSGTSQWR